MPSVLVEAWLWFSVALVITLARMAVRIADLGHIKRLQADDCLIVLTLCFFTAQIVACTETAFALQDLGEPLAIQDHGQIVFHFTPLISKLLIVFDQCKLCTIWLAKGCLLILDYRITSRIPPQNMAIKIIIAYVGVSFFTLEIFYYFVWCRHFSDKWTTMEGQCGIPTNYLIMEVCFNISSDVAMIVVMVLMLARSAMPSPRKFFVCGVFGLAGFIIFCAAASKYYTFTDPVGSEWFNYYIREAGTAVIVANLPLMSSFIRKAGTTVRRYSSRTLSITSTAAMSFKRRRSTILSTSSAPAMAFVKDIVVTRDIDTSITNVSHACDEEAQSPKTICQFSNRTGFNTPWPEINPTRSDVRDERGPMFRRWSTFFNGN